MLWRAVSVTNTTKQDLIRAEVDETSSRCLLSGQWKFFGGNWCSWIECYNYWTSVCQKTSFYKLFLLVLNRTFFNMTSGCLFSNSTAKNGTTWLIELLNKQINSIKFPTLFNFTTLRNEFLGDCCLNKTGHFISQFTLFEKILFSFQLTHNDFIFWFSITLKMNFRILHLCCSSWIKEILIKL